MKITDIIIGALLFGFCIFIYFLPSYVAYKKNHKHLNAIQMVNVFLGWTIIGWICSLIWASSSPASQ